jgi:hypothetical protein
MMPHNGRRVELAIIMTTGPSQLPGRNEPDKLSSDENTTSLQMCQQFCIVNSQFRYQTFVFPVTPHGAYLLLGMTIHAICDAKPALNANTRYTSSHS